MKAILLNILTQYALLVCTCFFMACNFLETEEELSKDFLLPITTIIAYPDSFSVLVQFSGDYRINKYVGCDNKEIIVATGDRIKMTCSPQPKIVHTFKNSLNQASTHEILMDPSFWSQSINLNDTNAIRMPSGISDGPIMYPKVDFTVVYVCFNQSVEEQMRYSDSLSIYEKYIRLNPPALQCPEGYKYIDYMFITSIYFGYTISYTKYFR